ncbi:lipid storage droplets surface-binding protein 1-like isoform X3 [Harmonia axyridis]|nr:lipid storage droplets surface-binding protein 1-like isoform X3 [Harmonia axyridis]
MAENTQKTIEMAPTCMTSVNRVVKLPVVETTLQTASNVYEKVKDFNGYAKWGFETVENTLYSVVEAGKPYAIDAAVKLDGPIKKVDGVLCSGLDFVEAKVPAVKLPPCEIISQLYNSTKGYVSDTVTPRVDAAYKTVHAVVEPAVNAAMTVVDPAVQVARPTVEAAYKMVEPVVQPAVDRATALRDRLFNGEVQEQAEDQEEGRIPLILISWKLHIYTEFYELIVHIYYSLSLLSPSILDNLEQSHEDENENH